MSKYGYRSASPWKAIGIGTGVIATGVAIVFGVSAWASHNNEEYQAKGEIYTAAQGRAFLEEMGFEKINGGDLVGHNCTGGFAARAYNVSDGNGDFETKKVCFTENGPRLEYNW